MLLPLAKFKLENIDEIAPGTLVLPAHHSAHHQTICVVLEGGAFESRKVLLPLTGDGAFVPLGQGYEQALVLSDYTLYVRIGDVAARAPDKYQAGQLVADEDGPYFVLRLVHRYQERVYLVNLLSWTVEQSSGMKEPAYWPGQWELIARREQPCQELCIAKYPGEPSDANPTTANP